MRIERSPFLNQRILTLCVDTAYHLEVASEKKATRSEGVFVRSAIICITLLLESIANCCLYSLELPETLNDELDKLNTMCKLEYFLFSIGKNGIDRSCHEYQAAKSALSLRNFLVHPKVLPGHYVGDEEKGYVDWQSRNSQKALNHLELSADVSHWRYSHGRKVAETILLFIKKYFIEWAGYDTHKLSALLTTGSWDVKRAMLRGASGKVTITREQSEVDLISHHLPALFLIFNIRALPSNNPLQPTGLKGSICDEAT